MAMPSTPSKSYPYNPPSWAQAVLMNVPEHGRLVLANLPTPLFQLQTFASAIQDHQNPTLLQRLADWDISLYIKRDDMTGGVELGGNKIRKLEFLLADALQKGFDSVVTIGGEQSNHCRATASAARMVGLAPHLILRTSRHAVSTEGKNENFGTTGNIMVDRMVGSKIYTCTPGEYGRIGSNELVGKLCAYLRGHSNKPYPIPVGGSNGLGSWGYIQAVDEVIQQWNELDSNDGIAPTLDHVVFACGSGGTAAGIAIGMALAHGAADRVVSSSSPPNKHARHGYPMVHAIGVCDDPEYFYRHVSTIADDMGFALDSSISPSGISCSQDFIRQHMTVYQGKGLGYALSTQDELDFVTNFAIETGIVLDPVYTGKALYHFVTDVLETDPESYRGSNILFWHTGGALGMFDKANDLLLTLDHVSPVKRVDVYGKKNENDDIISI